MKISQLEYNIRRLIEPYPDKFSIAIAAGDERIVINADQPKKAASLIKIPLLIEAFRQIEIGILDPNELVYIDEHMKVGGAGVINQMTNSNIYSYINLLELMIIVSDNTAANIILDKIGIEQANHLAEQLNCMDTRLQRRFMDFHAQNMGYENRTTARDIQLFLQTITFENDFLDQQSRKSILRIMSNQQLSHKLGTYLPSDTDLHMYSKSGELSGVEHDAAIIKYRNRRIEAAILTDGWENNGVGSRHIAEIGKMLFEYITS
ncbi:serine hydrolase [Virgibacillus kekensis]|uniref:Serine hydrolase n=1 Tax=Virgibacillus kekensis TaxID=202261 RepID=A0ABV9DH78_9BACI